MIFLNSFWYLDSSSVFQALPTKFLFLSSSFIKSKIAKCLNSLFCHICVVSKLCNTFWSQFRQLSFVAKHHLQRKASFPVCASNTHFLWKEMKIRAPGYWCYVMWASVKVLKIRLLGSLVLGRYKSCLILCFVYVLSIDISMSIWPVYLKVKEKSSKS